MFYGNKVSYFILENIKNKILSGTLNQGFFVVSGPSNIGKKTLILNMIKELNILEQDKLILEDPGKEVDKEYQIKVDEELKIEEINNKKYIFLGARQISEFISTTPAGNYKLVFIENIERLNISSANALLKIFEEMPQNVFIFATSSNKEKLLETILSRAILINMFDLSFPEFKEFIEYENINLDENKKHLLFSVSGGRVGLAKKLLNDNSDLLDKLEYFLQLEENSSSIYSRFNLIKDLLSDGKIKIFLDALSFYYSHKNDFDKLSKIINLRKKHNSNVNIENLIFSYLIG